MPKRAAVARRLAATEAALADALSAHEPAERTPRRLFLPGIAKSNFQLVRDGAQRAALLQPAYSVKTNPRAELLGAALQSGFFAEVISSDELRLAASIGFEENRIVYNGPIPLRTHHPLLAFADSFEAFTAYCRDARSEVVGFRYRPRAIASRFGIPAEGVRRCAEVAAQTSAPGVALHFHVRPEDYAGRTWFEIASEALQIGEQFANLAAKPLLYLDIGGGWTPDALEHALNDELLRFSAMAHVKVDTLKAIIMEPGQAVSTSAEAVVTSVLEVRNKENAREAIVDTGYPDLPQIRTSAHRIFWRKGDRVEALRQGRDRVSGSTCLEYDCIATAVALPEDLAAGDVLYVCDAGAYDDSMAFDFAHGVRRAG